MIVNFLAYNEELHNKINEMSKNHEQLVSEIQSLQAQLEEERKKNDELVKDNISLQNSLKMAAAVGIKPQNYTIFQGLAQRDELERGTYLGEFTGTAYTPSVQECGNDLGITRSGEPIVPGISIAVDSDYWPLGTVFYIRGLGYGVAMDTGSAIKGRNRFDFAVFDADFARQLGVRNWDVYLVKMGDGTIDLDTL